MSALEKLILVDEQDNEIGESEKLAAHKAGKLHRSFSIFVYNKEGKMLLQQRAASKYHSPGLWSNTCCGHPRPKEDTAQAAHRRLVEELGFDCALKEQFQFTYRVKLGEDLWEHEFDHVFSGVYDGEITPNPEEASAVSWVAPEKLQKDVKIHPERYTEWFKIALERVFKDLALQES